MCLNVMTAVSNSDCSSLVERMSHSWSISSKYLGHLWIGRLLAAHILLEAKQFHTMWMVDSEFLWHRGQLSLSITFLLNKFSLVGKELCRSLQRKFWTLGGMDNCQTKSHLLESFSVLEECPMLSFRNEFSLLVFWRAVHHVIFLFYSFPYIADYKNGIYNLNLFNDAFNIHVFKNN